MNQNATDATLAAFAAAFQSAEYKAAEATVRGLARRVEDLEKLRDTKRGEDRAKLTVKVKAARKAVDAALDAKTALLARLTATT